MRSYLLLTFFCLVACREKYVSPYSSPSAGYLVVEGYISGNGPTSFRLTRTIPLPGDSPLPTVSKAKVRIEGSDNTVYPLTEQSDGLYTADSLPLNASSTYRLHINTFTSEEYLSDPVPFRATPPIDSISWKTNGGAVDIYANTHDPANATRYYQWQFDETWEYHSAEQSFYKYNPNTNPVSVVRRDSSEQVYRCWKDSSSSILILASTAKLTQDLVFLEPLRHIPPDDVSTGVLYSILVRQYALTEDAYNFLTLMKKNSESLGSIFDAQPSALRGNIHCLSNPNQPVIGFVSAGTVQQKRIFISSLEIPSFYHYVCPAGDTLVPNSPAKLEEFFGEGGFTPISKYLSEWDANASECVDCTLHGGNTKKPDFWPN